MRISTLTFLMLAAACTKGTELDVQAPSLAGASLTSGESSALVDASGSGQLLIVPELHGGDVLMTVTRGGATAELYAECVVPVGPLEQKAVDQIALQIRRRTSDGSCALIISSMRIGTDTFNGSADPALFDDAPCGAFATTAR